jgi:hypothetical protein
VNNGTKATNARNAQQIAKDFFNLAETVSAQRAVHRIPARRIVSVILAPLLPTHPTRAVRTIAVGSFPFDPPGRASHNVSIAVLRIGGPEPRGNTVRKT